MQVETNPARVAAQQERQHQRGRGRKGPGELHDGQILVGRLALTEAQQVGHRLGRGELVIGVVNDCQHAVVLVPAQVGRWGQQVRGEIERGDLRRTWTDVVQGRESDRPPGPRGDGGPALDVRGIPRRQGGKTGRAVGEQQHHLDGVRRRDSPVVDLNVGPGRDRRGSVRGHVLEVVGEGVVEREEVDGAAERELVLPARVGGASPSTVAKRPWSSCVSRTYSSTPGFGAASSVRSYTLLPWVAARRSLRGAWSARSMTPASGSPSEKDAQAPPPFVDRHTPMSAPTYTSVGLAGSTAMAFACTSRRLATSPAAGPLRCCHWVPSKCHTWR